MEHESNGDTNCNLCTCNDTQSIDKMAERVENRRTSRDHPNYSILKIGQNTEKSPGNLRFGVTQTPEKVHQLNYKEYSFFTHKRMSNKNTH